MGGRPDPASRAILVSPERACARYAIENTDESQAKISRIRMVVRPRDARPAGPCIVRPLAAPPLGKKCPRTVIARHCSQIPSIYKRQSQLPFSRKSNTGAIQCFQALPERRNRNMDRCMANGAAPARACERAPGETARVARAECPRVCAVRCRPLPPGRASDEAERAQARGEHGGAEAMRDAARRRCGSA